MKKLSLPLLVLLAACSSSDDEVSVTLTALVDTSEPFVPGDAIPLHAELRGLASPTYRWSAGGEAVPGATSADVTVRITDAVTEPTTFDIVVTVTGATDDNLTETVSDQLTITVQPGAENQAPAAFPDAYTIGRDVTLNAAVSVLANDTDDGFDGTTLTAVLGENVANGILTLNADGTFTYAPNAGYTGADTFTYTATDGTLSSAAATVTITVTATNQPPAAVTDAYDVDHDTTLTVTTESSVLANDNDDSFAGTTLIAVVGGTNVAHGTLTFNADGTFTYAPTAGYGGPDAFTPCRTASPATCYRTTRILTATH